MEELFEIAHECADLLVINKRAGLVCHPTKGDAYSSLISRVRLYFGGQVAPQLVNRLDRETSGVILVAKNSQAALELRQIWEMRSVTKSYLAIVHGHIAEQSGTVDAPLGKDEKSPVAVKDCVRIDGAAAQTGFTVLNRFTRTEGDFSLLRLEPLTGRKHQIRIHLAHIGHPIVGDKLYGGDEEIYLAFVQYKLTAGQQKKLLLANQALHAECVQFVWRREEQIFQASPERSFSEFAGISTWQVQENADSPVPGAPG